jgi:predicted acylesterase/phospholipase RssA
MERKAPTPSLSTRKKRKASQMPKVVNLALQGGGSHGAFTWGVLDRLLEEERLSFEGISATSAGAVNAVVLADGLAAGGREGAREALRVTCREPNRKVVDALFFRPAVSSLGQQRRASGLLIEATTRSGLITSAIEPGSIGRLESCQDPAKIAMIKVMTSMLAGSKRSEEGSLGRHAPG